MNKELNKETILYVIEDLLDEYKYFSKISQINRYKIGESLINKGNIDTAECSIKKVQEYYDKMRYISYLVHKYATLISIKIDDYVFDRVEVYDIDSMNYDKNKTVSYQYMKIVGDDKK